MILKNIFKKSFFFIISFILFFSVSIFHVKAVTIDISATVNAEVSFTDVSSTHLNKDAINYVKSEGIVNGYEDGSFKPDSLIRRDEFLKIILGSKFEKTEIDNCSVSPFSDVSGYWAINYVCLGKQKGIISGYEDGTFKPADNISLAEASKIITHTFGYTIIENTNEWWKPFVSRLEQNKSIPNTIESLWEKITRGEMAEMIYRLKNNILNKSSTAFVQYNPEINPINFSTTVNNKYLSFVPGTKMIYEGQTEDGKEHIEVYTTHETKTVMGVTTVVVWDRVWLDGELIEDTKDWYAQDTEGNVWYFGEESKEILNGQIINTNGSWQTGVDGAKAGIIMYADPKVGMSYRQEYYPGKAEDMGDVLALGQAVRVPYGPFTDCLKTKDWTPLEPDAAEHKYYCPPIGGVVLEIGLEDGERIELIDIKTGLTDEEQMNQVFEEIKTQITQEEAKAIALEEVPGIVTDIGIEQKFGKTTYVVEVDANSGPETDVIIDITTGQVLGTEI